MSSAGQNTFTGTNYQADIALLFLLENHRYASFKKVILEGSEWEDFTLFFEDRTDSYEVKWHKSITYSDVKVIIEKEMAKQPRENYNFKIICKKLSPKFKEDYDYIKNYLYFALTFNKTQSVQNNPVLSRFLKKGWSQQQIAFLHNTEIIELVDENNLENKIFDYFISVDEVFLGKDDIKSIVSRTFNDIMKASTVGDTITRETFQKAAEEFKKNIAEKSESFTPSLQIGQKVENLETFLVSEEQFKKLNHDRFLTPISFNPRLIRFITDNISNNKFSLKSIEFFITKILAKNSYHFTSFRVFEAKQEAGLFDIEVFLRFVENNYKKISDELVIHDVFKILLQEAKKKGAKKHYPRILKFLTKNSLEPLESAKMRSGRFKDDYTYKFKFLPELVELIGSSLQDSDRYLKFLFTYFDFTGDHYRLVTETPVSHYSWVKEYLAQNLEENFQKVLKEINNQFKLQYGAIYTGYEHTGSGMEIHGNSFSITDIGLVRFVFRPLFTKLYQDQPNKTWRFLQDNIFPVPQKGTSLKYPAFLKRSVVNILVDNIATRKRIDESTNTLKSILKIQKGFPGTSEVIFDTLRAVEVGSFGVELIHQLVKIDGDKYGQGGIPTNVLVIEALMRCLEFDESRTIALIEKLFANEKFRSTWTFKESISLMGRKELLPQSSSALKKFIDALKLPEYLERVDDDWINSDFVTSTFKAFLKEDLEIAKGVFESFVGGDTARNKSIEFFGNVINKLSYDYSLELWEIMEPIISNAEKFKSYNRCDNFKTSLIKVGESLLDKGKIDEAKQIVERLIFDEDPVTSDVDDKFNYHKKVKEGESVNIITTVRGYSAWLLQKFALTNEPDLMKYSFEKTKILLDLDGRLAKKLGYAETDYYVLDQALVPLIELAHPGRRKKLGEVHPDVAANIKRTAMEVLSWVLDSIRNGNNPKDIIERLVNVFSMIRDLNTEEVTIVLDLFEREGVHRSAFLFVYFALFREHEYESIPFNPSTFKERLKKLLTTENELLGGLAWQMWKLATDYKWDDRLSKEEAREYWTLLSECHYERSYSFMSMILEHQFAKENTYDLDFELLLKCINKEMVYLKESPNRYPSISLRKLAPLIAKRSKIDFLKMTKMILEASDFQRGVNIYGMNLPDLIKVFKELNTEDESKEFIQEYTSTRQLFKQLAVELD